MEADGSPLTHAQRSLLDFLLAAKFDGRDVLIVQSRGARSGGSSCDCGCASFYLVVDRNTAAAPVSGVVPVDAHGQAPDGSPIEVLLFVRDGYLAEIEIVWFGSTPYAELPDPSALTISIWSEPNADAVRTLLNP